MRDSWSGVETRLRVIEETVADLSVRLARLESRQRPGGASSAAAHSAAPPVAPVSPSPHSQRAPDYLGGVSLAGRVFVALGGAFLLRALTESGRVPVPPGIAIGLVYAVAWLIAADRTARRQPLAGFVHGLAAVLIGLPLLWEAAVRFHVLAPAASAAALGLFTLLILIVARARRLAGLAGAASAGLIVAAFSLALATGAWWPCALTVVLLSIVLSWTDDVLDAGWVRWPAAIAADVMVGIIALRAGADPPAAPPAMAVVTASILGAGVTGLVATRMVLQRRPLRTFDAAQAFLSFVPVVSVLLAAGANLSPSAPIWIDGGLVAAGVLAYGTAVSARGANAPMIFRFYSVCGLVVMLTTVVRWPSGTMRDSSLVLLAVGAVGLSALPARRALALHSILYATAAAASAGVVAAVADLLLGTPAIWPAPSFSGGVAVVTLAVVVLRSAPGALRTGVSAVLATVLIGVALRIVGPALAGTPPDAGLWPTLVTAAFALSAILVGLRPASAAQRRRRAWLTGILLTIGGLELVRAFVHSAPAELFVALFVYGAALIVTARLMRITRA